MKTFQNLGRSIYQLPTYKQNKVRVVGADKVVTEGFQLVVDKVYVLGDCDDLNMPKGVERNEALAPSPILEIPDEDYLRIDALSRELLELRVKEGEVREL